MTDKIAVKLLFFAKARELTGKTEAEISISGEKHTLKTLLHEIINFYESLQPLVNSLLIAINEEYVDPSQTVCLKNGDIVAILPPLSGG